jgi:AraC-like DNA-binding protein
MDALSELLKVVKLSGAMFFNAECTAPWCIRSPPSHRFGPYIAQAANHIIEFHLLAEGRGYVRVGQETTPLVAGDIVMIPHGDPHYMGNGAAAETIDAEADMAAIFAKRLELVPLGGGGESTRLICGYLACEARLIQPVLAGLPRVIRVNIRSDPAGQWLENSIRHAVSQAASAPPGGEVILARLAEVLFTETLRRYLLMLPPGRTGWLAGAGDATVGRSLAVLHGNPQHSWTLDELAREAGVSRSALTERFARYLGQSPMAYLADWRLELGAEYLRTTSRSVFQIAVEVGYDSEAAFNRAFKRRFGKPPAQYRKALREQTRERPASSIHRAGADTRPAMPGA